MCAARRTTAVSTETYATGGSKPLLDGARPGCTGRSSWPGKQPRYPAPGSCGQQPPLGSSGKQDLTIIGFVLGEPACGSLMSLWQRPGNGVQISCRRLPCRPGCSE